MAQANPLSCGSVLVEFIARRNAAAVPTQSFKTPRGYLQVSTPEATAFDLIGYRSHAGGLDNIVSVLAELAESLDTQRLAAIAELSPIAWSQRLGNLLCAIGEDGLAEGPAEYLRDKKPVPVPLLPSLPWKGVKQDRRWRVLVNETVEPEA